MTVSVVRVMCVCGVILLTKKSDYCVSAVVAAAIVLWSPAGHLVVMGVAQNVLSCVAGSTISCGTRDEGTEQARRSVTGISLSDG